ncbi:MAG: ATP-binding protein [Pseudochelatococcus sp.]|jgi:signal transduction histidine kinase|uniref:ATP-binding protein n=1 Tax=Pseudochelatococcus sp. TaxID=2020869 RepID=UPI003D90C638
MISDLATVIHPRRIAGQIALLSIAAVVLSQILISTVFLVLRPLPQEREFERRDAELAAIVGMVDDIAAGPTLGAVTASLAGRYPWLGVSAQLPAWATVPLPPDHPAVARFGRRFGEDVAVYHRRDLSGTGAGDIALRLANGMVLIASGIPEMPPGPPAGVRLMVMLGFLAPVLVLLTFWAVTAITAPLRRFAEAAENFDVNREHEPLLEQGPEEIRSAARAFNRMRDRIKELIDERTQMLLAVSHDLRTPITRLRLRTEFIEDEAARTQMERDLDQINAMLGSALSLIRDERTGVALSTIDIASLTQTVTDEFAELGHGVSYIGPDRLVCLGRLDDMHRVLTNLVGNAVRHARTVVVRLRYGDNGGIVLTVEDDGPGIPPERREAALKPFVRLEDERPVRSGQGFGLGLAIARSLVRAQGGRLSLHDNVPHGLVARIDLPQIPAHSSVSGHS